MTDAELTRSLELIKRAQGGEDDALNRLFGRYYDRVLRVVRMRLGGRLRTVLESGDILQDTFAAAVRSFESFEMRDEASLIHWLSKLAEHQICSAAQHHGAKKRERWREVPLPSSDDSQDVGFEPASPDSTPAERTAVDEQQEIVESCVGQLPEEYRELVILRNYTGASWETVAHLTGRPSPDAARQMHARGMIELGKLLKDRGVKP